MEDATRTHRGPREGMDGMHGGSPTLPIGHRVSLPGHFDVPVILEDARALGVNGSGGYECRVRLPDGRLDEGVISVDEARALAGTGEVMRWLDCLNRSPATKGGASDYLYRQFREELPRWEPIKWRRAIPRNGTG